MEIHFRTTCYTHLPQSKTPTPHTILTECMTVSCLLTRPCGPPQKLLHLLCSALTISKEIFISWYTSYSLDLSGIFLWLCFLVFSCDHSVSFLPFLKKNLKRGVSTHWLFFLTSHSILQPQSSDFTSWFPFLVTISVDSKRTSEKSSIMFRDVFFWCLSLYLLKYC